MSVDEQAAEAPAVEPVVEAEPAGDPLLAAIDEGFSEMDRLRDARDGTPETEAEPEPAAEDATAVPWAELSRLDQESGQSAWRQEQLEQRYAVEDEHQWRDSELSAVYEQQYAQARDAMFADVLDRLDASLEQEDRAAAVHLADEVAANGDPAMLGEFLVAWDQADPHEARGYEAAYRARAAEAEQAGFQEGQRLAEMQQAGWQDEYVRQWQVAEQQQQAANAEAMAAEVNRLSAADPAFSRLAPTVLSIAESTLREMPGEMTPELAAGLVRSAYENAVALQAAKESAPFLAALDKQLDHEAFMADGSGLGGRFDPERAKFTATAELLKSTPLGEVSRGRQRSLAGDRPGHLDAYGALAAFDEQLAREAASRESQAESMRAIERSRRDAEAAKKAPR